ncbi:MAG: hypothetical protein WDN08_08945 [Rhizomicrobium sp.]
MSQDPVRAETAAPGTLSIDEAINPFVKRAVLYWRAVRGDRRFPARGELTLRGMASILPYCVIISVIDGGADFEYRYVGDAQRQAFKTSFKGLRLSLIEGVVPQLGAVLRSVYEHACALGLPFLVRGAVDHDPADPRMLYHETVFLPLGASDAAVDHILVVGVQIPRPYWTIPAVTLTSFADRLCAEALGPKSETAP